MTGLAALNIEMDTLSHQRGEAQIAMPLGRYRAEFSASHPVRFSDFPGSAWRGALGHALKRTVCVTRAPQCGDCVLYRSCLYPYFYDTPPAPDATKMRRYVTAPHPFVLEPDSGGATRAYRLVFTLVGQANRHLPIFVHALQEAAESDRGVSGNRLELVSVQQEVSPGAGEWRLIYEPDGNLTPLPPATPAIPMIERGTVEIRIDMPLRVKRDGRHVGPEDFRFADLFSNVLRRISMLTHFHTATALDAEFRHLIDAAKEVEAQTDLRWRTLTRYSTRQKTVMKVGGVVGSLRVEAAQIQKLWPFLWLGQWVHAGSGATMGLGQYHVASLPHTSPSN